MTHVVRPSILLPGADMLMRAVHRIAAHAPALSSLRAPGADIDLTCLATMLKIIRARPLPRTHWTESRND
jgi:hypothetical protein